MKFETFQSSLLFPLPFESEEDTLVSFSASNFDRLASVSTDIRTVMFRLNYRAKKIIEIRWERL